MINYIKHERIDKSRWDECIEDSGHDFIYAMSWYLDIVAPSWDALVLDNYQAVMPLTYRTKMGIKYIFTPLYAQQLGVFAKKPDEKLCLDFIGSLPAEFRIIDLKMNESNSLPAHLTGWRKKINYTLDIGTHYDAVRKGYNRNCIRNLKKATDVGLKPGECLSAEEFALFIGENLRDRMRELKPQHLELLSKITGECLQRKRAEIVCIRNDKDKVVAAGSFLSMGERIIFSVCASTQEGRKNQAMYMLVDEQIKKCAGRYRVFDFSGSEIKGIAYFNSTFGAKPVQYPFIHINRLNLLQRLISGKIN